MKYGDKQTFKLIDYDGAIWNRRNDAVAVRTPWQGTLPFCAPEMNDYLGNTNDIRYAIDVWHIGILILYCINGGDLGLIDMKPQQWQQFYDDDDDDEDEQDEEARMRQRNDIFCEWYHDVFVGQDGMLPGYQRQIKLLYQTEKISPQLYDLLYHGILIKKPRKRMSIGQVLKHEWFDDIDEEEIKNVMIEQGQIDLYEGIMSKDINIRNQVINIIERMEPRDTDEDDTEYDDSESTEEEGDEKDTNSAEDTPEIRYYSDDDDAVSTLNHDLPHLSSQYGASSLSCYSNVSAAKRKESNSSD